MFILINLPQRIADEKMILIVFQPVLLGAVRGGPAVGAAEGDVGWMGVGVVWMRAVSICFDVFRSFTHGCRGGLVHGVE